MGLPGAGLAESRPRRRPAARKLPAVLVHHDAVAGRRSRRPAVSFPDRLEPAARPLAAAPGTATGRSSGEQTRRHRTPFGTRGFADAAGPRAGSHEPT